MSDTTLWVSPPVVLVDGRHINAMVVADSYLDGSTVRERDHKIRVRVTPGVAVPVGPGTPLDETELSATEARKLAGVLNQAAAQIEQATN